MKFNELSDMMQKPDTYEASMALNQLMRIGKHAIKLHNMIDDAAEMESWVAKKIDLAGDYVKKVHGYMQGEKAGLYDDGGLTEARLQSNWAVSFQMPKGNHRRNSFASKDDAIKFANTVKSKGGIVNSMKLALGKNADDLPTSVRTLGEDAGEGHMSKSTLYHTAKYAIALMDMIKPGDDLEGWVQSKLNKAADYLQGVYNYEEYQKLNPYREELDATLMQKHAQVVQKNIDEILSKETKLDDIDTKPGMMRILAKRVNEVEKEIAKETRKKTDEEAPPGREKQVKALKKKFKDKGAPYAIAWAQHNKHGKPKKEAEINEDPRAVGRALANLKYGKAMANAIMKGEDMVLLRPKAQAYLGSIDQTIELLDKMYGMNTENLDEGIKDWAKNLAMAGVLVAGLAGINSINNAIDNSIPAVKAMNTALDMAQDSGNDELAKMIEKDLSDAKVRLTSGKDLGYVAGLQDKYAKFMKTEGLAYESQLALALNQRLK